ncbi:MAG: FdhF/YdeP family oxidoreductase [Sporichthyaceae bacterium]
MRKPPIDDVGDEGLKVGHPEDHAAGLKAVAISLRHANDQMGIGRSLSTLRQLNQKEGFDCPGCAWPEGDHRHLAEFCENGVKAVAEEATKRRITADFFRAHSISELSTKSGYWLGQQGRFTEPMVKPPGKDHYEPIAWHHAFDLIARHLRELDSPDEAVFYTSGRTSNEAAFMYQLFVRAYGTNNLPDCSNMCHESSGSALGQTLGIGKGTVSLEDLHKADLILVAGQNPGTNHPRMLSALEEAKGAGARIVSINPLPEAGLIRFKNPQKPKGVLGKGTSLSDRYLQVRINGDLALFQALNLLLLEAEDKAPGTVLDRAFVDEHTAGFDAWAADVRNLSWDDVFEATGLTRRQIEELRDDVLAAKSVIVCWAMGLTQHRNSVPTIREVVNFLLLRGNVGRPGAGVCPVRGHSNVQGDRTMGIYEKPAAALLDALDARFAISAPRLHGYDVVEAIRAMRDGRAKVFLAMGGNFVSASPDTDVTEAALRTCKLTVQVSTKLNRAHLVCGETALILPTLGRTDTDLQASGRQFVSVEDSMGLVHSSTGRLTPASDRLLSEPAIVARVARAVFAEPVFGRTVPDLGWAAMEENYDVVREHIEAVIPGFDRYNERIRVKGGFALPNAPRDSRTFKTASGKAEFTVNPLEVLRVPEGRLLLQTMRSHDQYNTTIYGLDDRYRGIEGGRRVVFVNADDIVALGFADGAMVDLVGEWNDGIKRVAEGFRIVSYPTPRGCAAAYYPETNPLVPLDSTAEVSNTPTSKSVVVRLEPASQN